MKSVDSSVRETGHCSRKGMAQACVQIPPLPLTGCMLFFKKKKKPLSILISLSVKEGNDVYLLEL